MPFIYTFLGICFAYAQMRFQLIWLLNFQGMEYLIGNNLVYDSPEEIAKFLHGASNLEQAKKREYLAKR